MMCLARLRADEGGVARGRWWQVAVARRIRAGATRIDGAGWRPGRLHRIDGCPRHPGVGRDHSRFRTGLRLVVVVMRARGQRAGRKKGEKEPHDLPPLKGDYSRTASV